eukprot:2854004-Pyramimonas_sp.AAC.1
MHKLMFKNLVPDGHCACLGVCAAGTPRAVVERGADLLPRRVSRARRRRRCCCARGIASALYAATADRGARAGGHAASLTAGW